MHSTFSKGVDQLFWSMELGQPLNEWLWKLQRMDSKDAIPAILDLCTGLVGAVFKFNAIFGGIHHDLKPDNVLVLPLDETDGGCYFDTDGMLHDLEDMPRRPKFAIKLIDFGVSLQNVPSSYRRITSPEINCPQQLKGCATLLNSIHNDTFAIGCIILTALNKGRVPWHPPGSQPAVCPPELRPFFEAVIDFDRMHLSDVQGESEEAARKRRTMRARVIDAFYRYLVLFYTPDRRVMKALVGSSDAMKDLDRKLLLNKRFIQHVKSFSLTYGTETRRIRRCPVFKSKRATIFGLFRLMDPIPSARILPEEFLKLLKEREP